MGRVIRKTILGVVLVSLGISLLWMTMRPLLAKPDVLVLEVNDRSGLYLVDVNRGLTAILTRGRVEAPVWSPDGSKIAFLNSNGFGRASLRVMDANGGHLIELLPARFGVEYERPSWSPDSQQLVFTMRKTMDDPQLDIYIINADGTGLRQMTNYLTDDSWPSWSPDGNQIAFALHRRNGRQFNPNIYVMDANCDQLPGGCYANLRQITNILAARYPAWSPDGTKIALIADYFENLYVVDADGSNLRSIARGTGLLWYHWSPDSKQIVFASSTSARSWGVSVVDIDTGETHMIDSGRNAVAPAWSPDGSQIAFLGVKDQNFQVYLTDPLGLHMRQVTGPETDGFRFAWSP
ncbi:MAG: hypothetical protein K8L99_25585 [Anaerolineae bacterium]|nr:hypothetical protein [Anaerolineae bacterium]